MAARSPSSSSSAIVRAMGLFSGVKVVTIICSLIRNKLIACFIGPVGLGLVILYNSVIDMVGSATRLSIDQSAQRDISQSQGRDSSVTVSVVRRWAVWLGLAGAAVMCALSPLLSVWSFDTTDRWPVFCILSVVPLCVTIANCSIAINQGLRRLGAVAAGTVYGAIMALVVSVPLILLLGIDAIVWILITYGLCTLAGAWIFRARVPHHRLDTRQIIERGRPFLRLGLNITLATFFNQALSYGFVLFLNNYASTSVLGTYQAGFTLVNTYVGVILTGIWMEYYPRISSMAHSSDRLSTAASHEVNVTMFALIPVLSAFIALADPIIRLIYSSDFLTVVPFVTIASIGVILRATSWCMAYVILARGDGRTYLLTEGLSSVLGLGLNIGGYLLGGFAGLGISYILWYAAYTAIVATVCRRRYNITYRNRTITLVTTALATVTAAYLLGHYITPYIPGAIAILTAAIAYRHLRH